MTRDLREYSRKTDRRLLVGFLLLLFLVGEGLIYLFYGQWAAFLGLFCLLGVGLPALTVWGVIVLMEKISGQH